MRRLVVVVALLAACSASPTDYDAWVNATTLKVRPCVPDNDNACHYTALLPFGVGVQLTGETRTRRTGCATWHGIEFIEEDGTEGHGFACATFLLDSPPTPASIKERLREHRSDPNSEEPMYDALMLAGLTDPAPFEAVLATGVAAARQVRWARGAVVNVTPGPGVISTVASLPPDDEEGLLAWAQGQAGQLVEGGLSGPPSLWRHWIGPHGEGRFVLLQVTRAGYLVRFAGTWTPGDGSASIAIVADSFDKKALQRTLDRVPGHLRRDASPATWTGTDD